MQKQTKPEPLMASMAKMILAVSFIVGIGAVLGILGYALTKQKPAVQNPPAIEKADETVDWKIYRNEKYGFEIEYPKNWKIGENPTSVSLEDTEHKIRNINIGGVIYFRFNTTFDEALKGFGFKEEDGNYFIRTSSNSWINAQEKNINGIRVIVGEPIMLVYEGSKYTKKEGKRFFFIGKNSYVVFETAFYEEYNDIFNQILSTFKFIEKEEIE